MSENSPPAPQEEPSVGTSTISDNSAAENSEPAAEESSSTAVAEPLESQEPTAIPPLVVEVQALSGALAEVQRKIDQLSKTFDDKIRYDAGREKIIDQLHAELEEQKGNWALRLLKPLALELIALYDDLGKLTENTEQLAADFQSPEKLSRFLADMQSSLEGILYKSGFDSFITEGSQYDADRQRIVKPVATADAAQNRHVAQRLRKGFTYEGRMIRKEMVNVYKHESSATE